MTQDADSNVRATVRAAQNKLITWLNEAAYPLWSTRGLDFRHGGFHECLAMDGTPVLAPRRARVQPRQVYAFAQAPQFGWHGDTVGILTHGLDYFLARFQRPDGLFRAVVLPNEVELPHGTPIDDNPVLYDQAFALLGLSAADRVLTQELQPRHEAERLRLAICRHFRRKGGGFASSLRPGTLLQSNPHMHLFEASLAWYERTHAPEWRALANEIGELVLARLLDPTTGAVRENFAGPCRPAPGLAGRIIEPGHQYEWAWLLLRWAGTHDPTIVHAARRLIEVAETSGIRRGVVINSLLDDLSAHNGDARLWPQAERLKANALAARLFQEERYWTATLAAATALSQFLGTPMRGLWYDKLLPSGELVREPAPASSFYHIVDAISELSALLR